ncbi:MAG: hypothetical protein IPN70_02885 [Candidatus Moraniibacteriota bacterium]|nr:MAG: hypothetical protein IPN70_02885 [Candidatus Moranbacteria bacterium]
MENHQEEPQAKSNSNLEQKWWFRIAKVAYIFLYLFFAILIIASGVDNFYSYDTVMKSNSYTPGFAFLNMLIVIAIGFIITKITKITFFYIFLAQKPNWKKELTKIF